MLAPRANLLSTVLIMDPVCNNTDQSDNNIKWCNCFLIRVETGFIGEINVWYFKPGQKFVTGEVRGPSGEATAVLLNEYDIPSKLS